MRRGAKNRFVSGSVRPSAGVLWHADQPFATSDSNQNLLVACFMEIAVLGAVLRPRLLAFLLPRSGQLLAARGPITHSLLAGRVDFLGRHQHDAADLDHAGRVDGESQCRTRRGVGYVYNQVDILVAEREVKRLQLST